MIRVRKSARVMLDCFKGWKVVGNDAEDPCLDQVGSEGLNTVSGILPKEAPSPQPDSCGPLGW